MICRVEQMGKGTWRNERGLCCAQVSAPSSEEEAQEEGVGLKGLSFAPHPPSDELAICFSKPKKIILCSIWSLDPPMYQRGRNKLREKCFCLLTLPFRKNTLQHWLSWEEGHEHVRGLFLLEQEKPRLKKLIWWWIT